MAGDEAIKRRFELLGPHLDERTRRLLAASEAVAVGRGGASAVAREVAAQIHAEVAEVGNWELRRRGGQARGGWPRVTGG